MILIASVVLGKLIRKDRDEDCDKNDLGETDKYDPIRELKIVSSGRSTSK